MAEQEQTKNIQWFPGHMAKTRRLMRESLPLVDAVVELRDARIVRSSRNPEVDKITKDKPRVILLNKADMADEQVSREWCEFFAKKGLVALAADCRSGRGLQALAPAVREAAAERLARFTARGMIGRPLRLMIVGIPNVGKSSLINRLAGGKKTKVEDRPGVTRGQQWVKLMDGMEMLDMPGVLWPKFDDQQVGRNLAYTGAVKDAVLDTEELAASLCALLAERYLPQFCARYALDPAELAGKTGFEMLEQVAKKRSMRAPGGGLDTLRASTMLLDEFRGGKIGRVSLETPEDTQAWKHQK